MTPQDIEQVWTMLDRPYLAEVAQRNARCVFATISGAHLYGFASPDSDVDLRGAFMLTARELLGLHPPNETVTIDDQSRCDLDWVAHDIRKFVRMLTQDNGYVLEQLYSPLVVVSTPAFEELKVLGKGCITRPTVRHYLGFARGRRERLAQPDPTVKHLLYAYRVLMSGLHLMRTGEVESNLHALNTLVKMPQVDELIARKQQGAEKMALAANELATHSGHLDLLEAQLHEAHAKSHLPNAPTNVPALEAWVIRLRLSHDGTP